MIYVGNEVEMIDKYKEIIDQANLLIKERENNVIRSLWLLIKGRFKFVTDEFCPYCHIKKGQIEDHIRGTLKDKINYRVNLGYLDLPSMCFLFCILHARL